MISAQAIAAPAIQREPLVADAVAALLSGVLLSLAAANAAGLWGIAAYAIAHLVTAGATAAWAHGSATPPRRQAVLLPVSVLFLGPLGAFGTLFSIILEAFFRQTARPFTEWFEDIFPEEEAERAELTINRIRIGGDPASGASELVSFTDVIEFGSIEQKQAVIALIARRFTPSFAPALRRALEDPVPAVRVQAAAAAATIEARFAQRGIALDAQWPQDERGADYERAQGLHHAGIASSGLMEPARARALEETALKHFDQALKSDPKDVTALAMSGRLHLKHGAAELAAERLSKALAVSGPQPDLCADYLEALFRLNRFDAIASAARDWKPALQSNDQDWGRLKSALALWERAA